MLPIRVTGSTSSSSSSSSSSSVSAVGAGGAGVGSVGSGSLSVSSFSGVEMKEGVERGASSAGASSSSTYSRSGSSGVSIGASLSLASIASKMAKGLLMRSFSDLSGRYDSQWWAGITMRSPSGVTLSRSLTGTIRNLPIPLIRVDPSLIRLSFTSAVNSPTKVCTAVRSRPVWAIINSMMRSVVIFSFMPDLSF